jgi:hypothetical protein
VHTDINLMFMVPYILVVRLRVQLDAHGFICIFISQNLTVLKV